MFQFNQEFAQQFCAARDPTLTRELDPQVQTFAQWLQTNAARLPIEG